MNIIPFLLCCCVVVLTFACGQKKKGRITFLPHYATEPTVLTLEKGMEELSGLNFDPSDSSVYAICDDKGSLFKLSLKDGKVISKLKFHEGKDYEDLAIVGDSCYVLNSSGNILSFNYKNGDVQDPVMHYIPEKGKNEFETLYPDKSSGKLVLMCKECDRDKNKGKVTTFFYDIATGSYTDGNFSLDSKEVLNKSGVEKKRFKPSAAAIHPVTGELFIISSVNKVLVVTSAEGLLKEVYTLEEKLFKQPEGIAFTPSGDMLISNESADQGPATLLYYKYHP